MSHQTFCHIERSLDKARGSVPARKATLLKQLLFTKMRDGENMMDHLNNFFGTVDKLREMEILVVEDLLAILLLYSIPDSYENFRCAIEARDELPSSEALKIKLHEEYNARKEKDVQREQHSQGAFHVKSFGNKNKYQKSKSDSHKATGELNVNSNNSNGFNNQRRIKYKCNYCNKLGHKASECWSKGNKKQSSSNAEEAFTVSTITEPDKNKNENLKTEKYADCENVEEKASLTIAMSADPTTNSEWCIDSGATSHMCHDRNKFSKFYPVNNQKVRLAVDITTDIIGKGTVYLSVPSDIETKKIRLENALCVPDLKTNLLSISKTTANGYNVYFQETHATVSNKKGEIVLTAKRRGDLHYIEDNESAASANLCTSEIENWHNRYGHLNEKNLKQLISKSLVEGMSFDSCEQLPFCETCVLGKQSATPFPQKSLTKSENILELIYSDVCGPMRVQSIGGATYFVTFIDDKSRYVEVFFLKAKSEVKKLFLKFKNCAENQAERKIMD